MVVSRASLCRSRSTQNETPRSEKKCLQCVVCGGEREWEEIKARGSVRMLPSNTTRLGGSEWKRKAGGLQGQHAFDDWRRSVLVVVVVVVVGAIETQHNTTHALLCSHSHMSVLLAAAKCLFRCISRPTASASPAPLLPTRTRNSGALSQNWDVQLGTPVKCAVRVREREREREMFGRFFFISSYSLLLAFWW